MDEMRDAGPAQSPFRDVRFIGTATSVDDVLMVKVPAFDPDHPFGDPDGVWWQPNVADDGSLVYPSDGDQGVAVESEGGQWAVLAWNPS